MCVNSKNFLNYLRSIVVKEFFSDTKAVKVFPLDHIPVGTLDTDSEGSHFYGLFALFAFGLFSFP